MKPIRINVVVLICANVEWEIICQALSASQLQHSPCGQWFVTSISSGQSFYEILFFHTGWGKVAAASATQYVIDRWHPQLLINLGTCGGLEGEVETKAIIMANRTVMYDIHAQIGDSVAASEFYTTTIDLSWLAEDCLPDATRTLIVSADRDILVSDVHWLKTTFGACAADWESAAIAFVAKRNHTRLLILRGVTDLVGSSGGEAYEGNFQFFLDNATHMLRQLVTLLSSLLHRVALDPAREVTSVSA